MKDVRSYRRGSLSNAVILRTRMALQMRTSALFGAKTFGIFRNLWCVRTDKGELTQCGNFADKKGRGVGAKSNFRNFVRTTLWTAPKRYVQIISSGRT